MSVMPLGAVLEMASTGVFACCARGSAAVAVVESVGPRITFTLSWLMNFWKTLMPCSLVDPSSSTIACRRTPPRELEAFIASTPASIPARCCAPYEAAAPVRLSAAPILAAFPEAPPEAPPPPEDPSLQAARRRRRERKTPTGTTLRLGMRALLGLSRVRTARLRGRPRRGAPRPPRPVRRIP